MPLFLSVFLYTLISLLTFGAGIFLLFEQLGLTLPIPGELISPLAEDSKKLGGKEPSYYLDLANHFGKLDESQVVIDLSAYQKRVNGECSSGQAIRVINEEGEVTCEQVSLVSGQTAGGSGVTSLTGGGGVTVNGTSGTPKTGALTLSTSGIPYSSLSLGNSIVTGDIKDGTLATADLADSIVTSAKIADGTITGSDLASNISISTSGTISTTGSGTITSAGLLTANNALTVSTGNLTLTGGSLLLGTGTLTSNVSDSASAIGFTLTTANTFSTAGAKLISIKNGSTEELSIDKDGNLTLNGNLIATGTLQGTQLISTVSTGTAPLVVSSTTQVANFNASLLEGNSSGTLMSYPQPNLILNSDFSRRNKWMTFMPEVFSDTSGWTLVTGTTLGTVAANELTPGGGAGAEWRIRDGLQWQDKRISAQFKFVGDGAGDGFGVEHYIDANNWVRADYYGGANDIVVLRKKIAGTESTVATGAFNATVNNYLWIELERQGTTYIAKVYNSGASPVAKSSATLGATASGTVSDSQVNTQGYATLWHNSATSAVEKWGGLSSGDGGVYVEGWGPESWAPIFSGTKGGQAFGFDETDQGTALLNYPWALRMYKPAANRGLQIDYNGSLSTLVGSGGRINASTAYKLSAYIKTSGTADAGRMLVQADTWTQAGAFLTSNSFADAQETSWTRKNVAFTSDPTAAQVRVRFQLNAVAGSGTYFVQLLQLEEGSTATPWRNAPADDDPIVWELIKNDGVNFTQTGNDWTAGQADPRNLAGNFFIPWDGSLEMQANAIVSTNTLQGYVLGSFFVDASNMASPQQTLFISSQAAANYVTPLTGVGTKTVSAGKHRVALHVNTDGGVALTLYGSSATLYDSRSSRIRVTATRGK